MRASFFLSTSLAGLVLAGCAVGPDYHRPAATTLPKEFPEAPTTASANSPGWRHAEPRDQLVRSDWWTLFGDPQLNRLEVEVDAENQTLKQAEANFRVARASVRLSRSAELPTLSVAPYVGLDRISAHQPYFNPSAANSGVDEFSLPLDLNYELDLWGRVRRGVTAARDQAQSSAADRETVRLALHAELAIDYFNLRSAIALEDLLKATVQAYEKALQLTQDRYDGGASPLTDVAQSRTQLAEARVQAADVDVQRSAYEHAIAVLIGRPVMDPAIQIEPLMSSAPSLPAVPGLLPSELLERRPDIASAERQMAAANERIGIARAAYYPTLSLSASAGFLGTSASNWLIWPSRFWAVGPTATKTLFDHGGHRANSEIAQARYDNAVATYRESVLTAVQQVQDNLAAIRELANESSHQHEATDAAHQTLDLFQTRYEGGVDTYLQVITWQTALLQNQRNDIDLLRRQLEASVLLIKALGGGWSAEQLPAVASLR